MSVTLSERVTRSCDADELEFSFKDGDSDGNKCKQWYGGAYDKVWRGLLLAVVSSLESGGLFSVITFITV
jgi:hypothetical protein